MRRNRQSICKALILVALAFAVGFFVCAGTAWGQIRDEVRGALEKTDRILEHARDIVTEVGSPRGHAVVAVAERIQRRAWEAFHRGQLRMAGEMTLRAREEIYQALGAIRQSEDNENEVERQLERTNGILQEIRDRVGLRSGPDLQRRLEAAVNTQRRAWDLYRERRLRPALRLTLQVRDMVRRIAEDVHRHGPGGPGIGAEIEVRMERLTEALERVGERVKAAENAAARENWERARSSLENARRAFEAGNDSQADRFLRQTRDHLERAMRLALREVRGDQIDVLIDAAADRWDLLTPFVQESSDNRLRDWHERAAEHIERARRALQEGKPQQALVQTRRAVGLLDKINEELGL